MPKPRASGGRGSTRVWSSQMLPADSGSSPARQFSAVLLPQPEGPSRAMKLTPPDRKGTTSRNAFSVPKSRLTPSSRSSRKSLEITYFAVLVPICWSQRRKA